MFLVSYKLASEIFEGSNGLEARSEPDEVDLYDRTALENGNLSRVRLGCVVRFVVCSLRREWKHLWAGVGDGLVLFVRILLLLGRQTNLRQAQMSLARRRLRSYVRANKLLSGTLQLHIHESHDEQYHNGQDQSRTE
jgi:hypothetical protein